MMKSTLKRHFLRVYYLNYLVFVSYLNYRELFIKTSLEINKSTVMRKKKFIGKLTYHQPFGDCVL